jgi:RNA polymerase sporulation-specific sigma factor
MLSHEETLALISEAQGGNNDAKEKLITENLPLIKSIVKRFRGRLEYDDLMQLGSIGFVKAMKGFDEGFGVRFSTYAVPMITGEIKRFLRDDGAIKVSRWAKALSQKIHAYTDERNKQNLPDASIEELAEHFGVEPAEIVFALDTGRYVLSLSDTQEEDGTPLGDKLVGANAPDDDIDKLQLKSTIEDLPEREKKIIILRYFRDKTQSEVAAELGVSQVQISRLENKILQKLREEIETPA